MKSPADVAERFRSLDVHDDTVEGFAFRPAPRRGGSAEITVVLFRYWEGKRREIRFKNCANFEVILDSDVLAGNAPCNTSHLWATEDAAAIAKVMKSHESEWNVEYEDSIHPLPAKLSAANPYVLFQVRIFGGVLTVVAKSFTIKTLRPQNVAAA